MCTAGVSKETDGCRMCTAAIRMCQSCTAAPLTPNSTGDSQPLHPRVGGFLPQKAHTYVHPEVSTGILTGTLHTLPFSSEAVPPAPNCANVGTSLNGLAGNATGSTF